MSSRFGNIAVVEVQEDGTLRIVKDDFDGGSKGDAVAYIENELAEDDDQRLQVIRLYPEIYEVEYVTEPQRVVTVSVNETFEETEEGTEEDTDTEEAA